MNRIAILYGCVLLASSAIAEEQQSTLTFDTLYKAVSAENLLEDLNDIEKEEVDETSLILSEIVYVEEDDVALGFETSDYLPEDFDPYTYYFDLNSIEFVEDENEMDLGFDTRPLLPEGFDPFSDNVGLASINFMEEDHIDLGFDTASYLPEGFSPYEAYFDLNSIIYIEDEDLEIEIDPISYIGQSSKTTPKLCK